MLLKPLINQSLLVLQLADVFKCPLQDSALVLVAVGDDVRELVDALVDRFAASALHWG